jgi:hypothetical protein
MVRDQVILGIITNQRIEKLDKVTILEEIFQLCLDKHDYEGAMVTAMGTGNKDLVSQVIESQKGYNCQ